MAAAAVPVAARECQPIPIVSGYCVKCTPLNVLRPCFDFSSVRTSDGSSCIHKWCPVHLIESFKGYAAAGLPWKCGEGIANGVATNDKDAPGHQTCLCQLHTLASCDWVAANMPSKYDKAVNQVKNCQMNVIRTDSAYIVTCPRKECQTTFCFYCEGKAANGACLAGCDHDPWLDLLATYGTKKFTLYSVEPVNPPVPSTATATAAATAAAPPAVVLPAAATQTRRVAREYDVPEARSCVKCGCVSLHGWACKHMTCPSCRFEYCQVCLSPKSADGSWPCRGAMDYCPKGVAPIQTRIANIDEGTN